ncbi:Transporter suffix domain-containing protein [Tumidithrix helvetica PCC 7403]|uniref:transporter suffix domain-containing protein n=1 Tax=Tumidithrix helvetica TaxID=3457545 RepID=UPI003CBA15F6
MQRKKKIAAIAKYLPLFLIVISFIPWLGIAALPFTTIPIATKAVLVPILAVLAEIFFWLGIFLAGKEAAQRYRRYFSPKFLWHQFVRWKQDRRK